MARPTQTPGKPKAVPEVEKTEQTVGNAQADPTALPVVAPTEEPFVIHDYQEQLDRIEQNQADITAKLDALLEQGGVAVKETKRWRHDPKRGHVFE